MIIRRGKFWLRVVKWDMLPHLLKRRPRGAYDYTHRRISWEEFRQILTGRRIHEAAAS